VLFDANALRYCFGRDGFSREELEELRTALRELSDRDLLRPITTNAVGYELTSVYFDEGPQKYRELLEFVLRLGSQRVLKTHEDREILELKRGRRLRHSEVFDQCDSATTLERDPQYIRDVHLSQRNAKDSERDDEAQKRLAVMTAAKEVDADWKTTFADRASADWPRLVRGFVKYEMRKCAKKHGLRIATNAWPRPDDLPTFWFGESFYVSKILHVLVESKKDLISKSSIAAMPDLFDATHFRDAAYADVLVTQDADFLAVARAAKTGVKVASFDDFARRILKISANL
jgi:hypothetical protein